MVFGFQRDKTISTTGPDARSCNGSSVEVSTTIKDVYSIINYGSRELLEAVSNKKSMPVYKNT